MLLDQQKSQRFFELRCDWLSTQQSRQDFVLSQGERERGREGERDETMEHTEHKTLLLIEQTKEDDKKHMVCVISSDIYLR